MKNRTIPCRLRVFLADQDGAIAIVFALLFPVLLGFAALSMDFGHRYSVQSQLKNAADAGALSGAKFLVPFTGTPATPDYTAAASEATKSVKRNKVDSMLLTDCTVEGGYWNFQDSDHWKPSGTGSSPQNYPAVKVTVSKTKGENGGPLNYYLASALGVASIDLSATSVAIIGFPTKINKGGLKPIVATKAIYDLYKDSTVPIKLGEPDKKDPTIIDTMWTSFQVETNSDSYTKDLIDGTFSGTVSINESIHLQPGTRAANYGEKEMGRPEFVGKTVLIPIVEPTTLVANSEAPVLGFAAFTIMSAGEDSKGGQYIRGVFDNQYSIPNPVSKSGTNSTVPGVATAPQLVN